ARARRPARGDRLRAGGGPEAGLRMVVVRAGERAGGAEGGAALAPFGGDLREPLVEELGQRYSLFEGGAAGPGVPGEQGEPFAEQRGLLAEQPGVKAQRFQCGQAD